MAVPDSSSVTITPAVLSALGLGGGGGAVSSPTAKVEGLSAGWSGTAPPDDTGPGGALPADNGGGRNITLPVMSATGPETENHST